MKLPGYNARKEWPRMDVGLSNPWTATIIIDNYNYAAFLGEAIESALAQTHPAQIVVVDDGSSDNSRSIIRSFGARIEAIFKDNGGQASALNAGYRRATGDVVFFLDADDKLEPPAVGRVLELWREGTVMVHYPMTIIGADNRVTGVIPGPPASLSDGDVRHELLTQGKFASTVMSGMAFSRKALAEVMPMQEREYVYAADGYLLRAVAFLGPVQYIDERLARYRIHGRNDSDPWATIGGAALGFRKKMNYAEREFETVRQLAVRYNLEAHPNLGLNDADYLGYRLCSLLLDPVQHPHRDDRRYRLLARYLLARWRASWSIRRRITTMAMTVLASFSKPGAALRLLHFADKQESRPRWIRKLSETLRHWHFSPARRASCRAATDPQTLQD